MLGSPPNHTEDEARRDTSPESAAVARGAARTAATSTADIAGENVALPRESDVPQAGATMKAIDGSGLSNAPEASITTIAEEVEFDVAQAGDECADDNAASARDDAITEEVMTIMNAVGEKYLKEMRRILDEKKLQYMKAVDEAADNISKSWIEKASPAVCELKKKKLCEYDKSISLMKTSMRRVNDDETKNVLQEEINEMEKRKADDMDVFDSAVRLWKNSAKEEVAKRIRVSTAVELKKVFREAFTKE